MLHGKYDLESRELVVRIPGSFSHRYDEVRGVVVLEIKASGFDHDIDEYVAVSA